MGGCVRRRALDGSKVYLRDDVDTEDTAEHRLTGRIVYGPFAGDFGAKPVFQTARRDNNMTHAIARTRIRTRHIHTHTHTSTTDDDNYKRTLNARRMTYTTTCGIRTDRATEGSCAAGGRREAGQSCGQPVNRDTVEWGPNRSCATKRPGSVLYILPILSSYQLRVQVQQYTRVVLSLFGPSPYVSHGLRRLFPDNWNRMSCPQIIHPTIAMPVADVYCRTEIADGPLRY